MLGTTGDRDCMLKMFGGIAWSLTFLLRLSSGGVAFTDLQQPTKTHRLAVRTMLMFTGTGTIAGSMVKAAKAVRALVDGLLILAPFSKTGGTTACCATACTIPFDCVKPCQTRELCLTNSTVVLKIQVEVSSMNAMHGGGKLPPRPSAVPLSVGGMELRIITDDSCVLCKLSATILGFCSRDCPPFSSSDLLESN